MNMKLTGIALALLASAGAGYGIYAHNMNVVAPAHAADEAKDKAAAPSAASTSSADDPVVAKVDGQEIHRSQVFAFIQNLPPQMKQVPPEALFPMALEQVINGSIVDVKAKAANTESSPEVAARLVDAKLQITRAVYAEKAIEAKFTEDQVKKAYDETVKKMPKVDEVHARHILVDKEDEAKDIIKKLEAGEKFEDLAKASSKDKSNSANGGDLGFFAQGDMVKEFSDAAFALKANEFTKTPVKTQFGFHVIQSLEKRVRPAPKFEDVKGQLEQQVRRDILNKEVEAWRNAAKVETFDINGKPVEAPKK